MAAYKDEARGTWYVSFHYNDWTGKNKRKLKRTKVTSIQINITEELCDVRLT